jgi:hypothetical protein
MWDGVAPDPSALANGAATQVILSPDPDVLLLCEEKGFGQPYQKTLWHAGQRSSFGDGPCDDVAWAADGTLAIGGGPDLAQAGSIVGPDGGVREQTLPLGTIIAGWLGTDLYFFAPDAGGTWQLYRLDSAGQDAAVPVGDPVAHPPTAPRMVLTR